MSVQEIEYELNMLDKPHNQVISKRAEGWHINSELYCEQFQPYTK